LTIGDKTTLQFVNNKIVVSNLELYNKKYVQYVKTNNNFAKIIIKLLKFSLIKLKSKIIIKINNYNIITLGSIYNYDNLAYKKASSFRYQG
jgi:ribosomal protein L2